MLAPLSCSIFLLQGTEMFKCICAGGRRLAYNFLQAIKRLLKVVTNEKGEAVGEVLTIIC